MMNVAARASETILNKVFDVCIWRIVLMLVDVCIYAFLGNAELFHQFVKSWSTNAEVSGCGSDFSRVLLKRLLNHFPFDVLACLSQSRCSRRHHFPMPFNSRSFAVTRDPLAIMTPRFTRFWSSRTFPGHE